MANRLVHPTARARLSEMQMLIEVARELRQASGPGQIVGEEKMMDKLAYVARNCAELLEEAGVKWHSVLTAPIEDASEMLELFKINHLGL